MNTIPPRLAIFCGLSLVLLTSCSKEEEVDPIVRPVRTMRVTESAGLTGRVFPGRAESVLAVDIAFEVSGKLIERPIQVGDSVIKGQMLAKIDPRDFANLVESAKARVERAVAYHERIEKAAKTGAVAQQDLTDAKAQLDIAEADLKIQEKALVDAEILAPFDGTIAAIYVENFQNVTSKQAVVRMMDLSEIELEIAVPEKLIMKISKIENIEVSYDAFPDQPVPAIVKEVGKEASATTRTFPVTLSMKQPKDFQILPGMTGQATGKGEAAVSAAGVFQIPGAAVVEEDGKHFVWIVDEASMTVARKAVTPEESNRLGMLVNGLQSGDLLVTAGAHNLSEGQKIKANQDN